MWNFCIIIFAEHLIHEMERFPFELNQFIKSVDWAYAKTMPDWPHYYIVRDKVDESLFVKLVEHIRQFGYEGYYYDKTIMYFEEDGLIYWTMGYPIDETTIINRSSKENSYEERQKRGTLPKEQ